jgi:glycopeptide antibiotics resistance protein
MTSVIGGLIGTLFIIATMSMLWKDNVFFRFGQAAVMGASIAHYTFMNFQSVHTNAIKPILAGNVLFIIPVILGLLMYSRLSSELSWLAKYPTSVLIGVGTGVMIAGSLSLRGQIIDQVKQTILDAFTGLNGILILIGVVTAFSFFIFTKEHTGALGTSVKIGRVFLMISLGANFSGELVWYLTQMIGRMMYILNEFIWPLLGA